MVDRRLSRAVLAGWILIGAGVTLHAQKPIALTVHWDRTVVVSRSTPTLQVVVNPPLRPAQPLAGPSFQAVKDLGADYVRYVPWLPYPRLAVAELEPPAPGHTSWDFSLIDPMMKEFLAATEGHPRVVNFSTMPAWLFKADKPVAYPGQAELEDTRKRLAEMGRDLQYVSPDIFRLKDPDALLENLVQSHRSAAWILSASSYPVQRWFAKSGLPTLISGWPYRGWICPTSQSAGNQRLLHAGLQFICHGHRHID